MKATIALFGLTLSLGAHAQATAPSVIYDDGSSWSHMTSDQKINYISGYNVGLWSAIQMSKNQEQLEHASSSNLTMAQEAAAIDQCYGDERNLKLPIAACWSFAVMQGRGSSMKELESHLASMRKDLE